MKKRSSWQDRDPRFREESGRYEHPIPSRAFILQALAEAGQPLGFGGVCERLGVKDRAVRQALTKRLGAMVRDAAYQSSTPDFWASCDGVGGPATYQLWGTAADGKGEPGQTNQVSHGCPPARFRNITVLNTAAV